MSSQTKGGITVEFGQYEPLTRRLNNLLKEYKDGFSIPKELIQNADDAGATQVHFVYDMRENDDARTGLLDERLSEFQGRALWAYNDAVFTNNDFENIRKLGGATKEEDTTKVGKFGLGFNSVYNLTDVPSFISGNQAVIFDPHQHYLGKPGIHTDLIREQDKRFRSRWMNQLKPFEGLFGCSLRKTDIILDGTLFRFPLRTQAQAERSEIKRASYSDAQMKEFFTVFAKYAGSLLLFTQCVRHIAFSILLKDGHPQNPVTLITVNKKIRYRQISASMCHCENVLQYASSRLEQFTAGCGEHDYIIEENTIRVYFQKFYFTFSRGFMEGVTKTHWCVAWYCGTQNAKRKAKRLQLKGLIPLGAVAIPLKCTKNVLSNISDCGTGFYNVGYLYCFMPLPIATKHPVHINATFALTPDRRQLCCNTEDDTSTAEAEWNEVLKSEVIGYAWIYCLQKCHEFCKVGELAFYTFWPVHDKVLTETFCRTIIEGNLKIFVQDRRRRLATFREIVILDPGLRRTEGVGDTAFRRLKTFYHSTNTVVADLPQSVIDAFNSCGFQDQLRERTISIQVFFRDIVFPHIKKLSAEDRNELVIFALESKQQCLLRLVAKHKCIPTEPQGTLKMPNEIIDPSGEAAELFQSKEEVILQAHPGFRRYSVCQVLQQLGMTKDELSGEEIVGRAKVCEEEASLHLARKVISYLWNTSTSSRNRRRFQTLDHATESQLGTTSFLPVLSIPPQWPSIWLAESCCLVHPTDLYNESAKNLVGCTKFILNEGAFQMPTKAEDLWTWLGVKNKTQITLEDTLMQLWYVSQAYSVENAHLQICHDIYKYIEDYLARNNVSEADRNMSRRLANIPVVVIENKLIEPNKIALKLSLALSPYLYKADASLKEHYPKLLNFLGVRKHFHAADILPLLARLQQKLNNGRRSQSTLHVYIRAVQVLVNVLNDDEPIPVVQLPSTDGKLYDAKRLCLNDCGWINKQRHMLFLHPSIAPADGQRLGVRTKREASLSGHISSIPYAKGFGQHEELTTRIKRILSGYPRDQSVLKELLQNADDAGATELVFIKDFRTHPSQRVFNEKWKLLQGPALCVYNNSHFDEEDMKGLQNLGIGSKSTNPLKTGQYGVGFNAVYHLTDVPSFMTVGPERQKTLCVLDPNKSFTPRTEDHTPGIWFTDLDILKDTYCDVFPCYLEESVFTGETGTLFRLPLRTESMAEVSNLSKYETSTHDIEQMLEAFMEQASVSLLFLTNVKKITFCSINELTGGLVNDYTVETLMTGRDLDREKQFKAYQTSFLDTMAEQLVHGKVFQTALKKTVKDSKRNRSEYLVVHQVGYSKDYSVHSALQRFIDSSEICLLPKGGVAIPLKWQSGFTGTLFCILPLPQVTGLPVHINGHFALEHEARRNLWHGEDGDKVMWNELIMNGVVAPAYLYGLQILKKFIQTESSQTSLRKSLDWYNSVFPRFCKGKDCYVTSLIKSFYSSIARKHLQLFPMMKGSGSCLKLEWMPVTTQSGFPGIFDSIKRAFEENTTVKKDEKQNEEMKTLRKLLKDLGMPLLDSPLHLMREFDNTEFKGNVCEASPETVVNFLKSSRRLVYNGCVLDALPKRIEDTPLRTKKNVLLLTKFCNKYEHYMQELDALPLMLTQSKVLHRFTSKTTFFVTKFHDLLPSSARKVLHNSLVSTYRRDKLYQTSYLKYIDTKTLSALLKKELNIIYLQTNEPCKWTSSPSQSWIVRFWEYIFAEKDNAQSENLSKPPHETLTENEILKRLLLPLNEFAFIPVAIDERVSGKYLFPVSSRNYVVSPDFNGCEELVKIIRKMKIPKLDTESLSTFVYNWACRELVSSLDKPDKMLAILQKSTGLESDLSCQECQKLLEYFNDNLDVLRCSCPDLQMQLKSLSFWPALHGEPTSLCQYQKLYSIPSFSKMPTENLKDLVAGQSDFMVIEHSIFKLLEMVGVEKWSIDDVYNEVIVPALMQLPLAARHRHLYYIRVTIIGHVDSSDDLSNVKKQILNKLQRTPFIRTSDRQYHVVEEFYSRRIELFRLMCPERLLPPPFDQEEWQHFLERVGLHCNVSEDDFIRFTKQLEKEAGARITKDVGKKSTLLVNSLKKNLNLFEGVKFVKFLLPLNVKKQDYAGILDICPQFENAKCLVSYANSCAPSFYFSVWSSSTMWTMGADISAKSPCLLNGKPSPQLLVTHIKKIAPVLQSRDHQFMATKKVLLQKMFTFIYEQLEVLDARYLTHLQETCCIYIDDFNEMVKAKQVVIEITNSQVIHGYVFKAPTYFGKFFSLFQKLGAQKCPSPQTYAVVLQNLFDETRGEVMNPNELKLAVDALVQLSDLLHQNCENDIGVDSLYLPSSSSTLVDSRRLTYQDKSGWEERLSSLQLVYCIEVRDTMLDNSKLPEKYQMMVVSHKVKERLSAECSDEIQSGLSCMYEGRIKSGYFINGIIRICHDNDALETDESDEIEKILTQIRLRQVEKLQTVLEYNGKIVDGSAKVVDQFVSSGPEGTMLLYKTNSEVEIVSEIAQALDHVTHGKLKSRVFLVMKMLQIEPEEISSLLDQNDISSFVHLLNKASGLFPKPGTLIPARFHGMLEAGFYFFKPGEYVGLDVYDPFIDSTNDESVADNALPEFVYAIVKEVIKMQASAPSASKYVVEISNSSTVHVCGAQLYKFKRDRHTSVVLSRRSHASDSEVPEGLKEVLENIRKHLKFSWKHLSPKDWKRVVLRLLLKWHPDKNLDNVEFCTEVCQFISALVKKLESGGTLKDRDRTDSSPVFRRDFSQTWFHREFRRRERSTPKSPPFEHSTRFHDSVRREKHPHFGEARRWLRQAEIDLDAARQALDSGLTTIYNWICFMAQQASEKAVKAVVYTTDSYRADSLRRHNLIEVASGTDIQLQDLAGNLQNQVQDYNRMRYPDRLCFPNIPSDVYTRTQALDFLRISEQIVRNAGEKILQQQ